MPLRVIVDENASRGTKVWEAFRRLPILGGRTECLFLKDTHPGIPDVEILDKLLGPDTILVTADRVLHMRALERGIRSYTVNEQGQITRRRLAGVRMSELPNSVFGQLQSDYRHQPASDLSSKLKAGLSEKQPKRYRTARRRINSYFGSAAAIGQVSEFVMICLQGGKPQFARSIQSQLEPIVTRALKAAPEDVTVLNLAGYHKKNAFMIQRDEQPARPPPARLLEEAEKKFFDALSIRPNDPSALNGLGSVLILREELDAAEFFVQRALAKAKEDNLLYAAAENRGWRAGRHRETPIPSRRANVVSGKAAASSPPARLPVSQSASRGAQSTADRRPP